MSNTLAEWRRRLVGRPSLAVVWRGDFTTAWEGRNASANAASRVVWRGDFTTAWEGRPTSFG